MYYKNKENKPYFDPSINIVERDSLEKITEGEFKDLVYKINNPVLTDKQLAQLAQHKMRTELEWCDLMLKYVASGDTQRSGGLSVDDIYAYAIACRNHVITTNDVLYLVGSKPIRPI